MKIWCNTTNCLCGDGSKCHESSLRFGAPGRELEA
jgi:hypothetical protein